MVSFFICNMEFSCLPPRNNCISLRCRAADSSSSVRSWHSNASISFRTKSRRYSMGIIIHHLEWLLESPWIQFTAFFTKALLSIFFVNYYITLIIKLIYYKCLLCPQEARTVGLMALQWQDAKSSPKRFPQFCQITIDMDKGNKWCIQKCSITCKCERDHWKFSPL